MLINKRELERCEGQERSYSATDSDPSLAKFLSSHTPVEQVVRLRLGAQVYFLDILILLY